MAQKIHAQTYLREIHKYVHQKMCTRMFKAIFIKLQSGNIQIPIVKNPEIEKLK